ncbi:unnamed protein product [Brassica napus]|uniref:(rape) hypothetical protein n=1 Tax=Brassica napus TaxID=3708 RepID=A0A816IB42_BRANA|nr:unnamed protein product [Brassica napus]
MLSIGVCPETGGFVIVLLSPVGFRRRISVGEDGGGCFKHVSLFFERLTRSLGNQVLLSLLVALNK